MPRRPYAFYPWYAPVPIPVAAAVCPSCGSPLTAAMTQTEQADDGTWQASEIEWTCASDPDSVDDDGYDRWLRTHDTLTYQESLEVEAALLAWLTAHVRFVEGER